MALAGVAGKDWLFARITGFKCALSRIEPQTALLLFRTMTFETMLFQDRANIADEVRRGGHCRLSRKRENQREDPAEHQNGADNPVSILESHKCAKDRLGSIKSRWLTPPASPDRDWFSSLNGGELRERQMRGGRI